MFVWPFISNIRIENGLKKVYNWKLMLKRPLGRPKNRGENDIRNDMQKLKIKKGTICIQNRNNWNLYGEKDKTLND